MPQTTGYRRRPDTAAGRMSAATCSVSRMKHGFIFTGTEPNLAVELAGLAEASGWDAFFVWEGIWATDPWATLAAAAMVTDRIRLGTMLTPVPRRRPWELAGQTMTVDRLSNGRVILSVGLGVPDYVEQRFWIFEDDPGRRVRAELLDEGLELMQHLWRGEPFEYEGRHYHAERTESMLPPSIVQHPRIPTWVVGVWPRMRSMRRVARYDGWIPNYAPPQADGIDPVVQQRTYTPDIAAQAIAWIREERDRIGLGDRPFDIIQEGTTGGVDPEADAAVVRPWADAGATWWLESDWQVPATEVAEYARARVKAGPPRP
jgi:alkanesulfonate monooxygenase SsuD/methylene tetrahydromethanopterin reductase-like flavin-dependent oxidoreductase (luciferase family)